MKIKTKFNVGDKVWYVSYDNIAYDCPHCGEECYNEKPCGAKQGEIYEICITHNICYHNESYKIIAERYESGICSYTDRQANRVYATEEEAQKAYSEEFAEWQEEQRLEKQRVIEFVKNHYEIE